MNEETKAEGCAAAEGKKCICGRVGKKCLLCRILKAVLWVVAALVVVLLALPLWIGPVATGVANSVVPKLTGTDFNLESFSLNPYSGRLCIKGCRLANPPGFQEKDAFSVASLSVQVSVASLLTSKIHVYDVSIDQPYASYLSENGTNNFDYILANLAGDEEDKEEEESASDKKVVIDRLCLSGTRVKLGPMPVLPFPTITIEGIGAAKEEGASFSEVGDAVLQKVQSSMGALGGGLKSLMGGVTDAVSGDAAKSATDAVGNAAKGATDAVGNAAKGATEAVGNAAKALGGLFGGDKK